MGVSLDSTRMNNMSEQKRRLNRFFVEYDIVRHKPTGEIYEVHDKGWYEDHEAIFFEYDGNVDVRIKDTENYLKFPFDELELVESAGVYMGVGRTCVDE